MSPFERFQDKFIHEDSDFSKFELFLITTLVMTIDFKYWSLFD